MIVDDVEGFLKFLDNASYQLTCLLDIDGSGQAKRNYAKQKVSLSVKSRPARLRAASTKGQRTQSTRKRHANKDSKVIASEEKEVNPSLSEPQVASNESNQQHLQQGPQANLGTILADRHSSLENPLTLGIADELPALDHVTSISPDTHLSPIDPNIQFGTIHHQQHYYTPHREAYPLHDEFTSHESIPISNSSPNIGGQQPVDHQNLMINHQPHQQAPSILRNASNNSAADCCHDHNRHHTNNQLHHHQQQDQHHHHQQHMQYQQIDQQWLCPTMHSGDVIHMNTHGVSDSAGSNAGSLVDHDVNLSQVTHQSLDQVQFSAPLYHHSYYNQQTDHLDSFQHLNDDYSTTTVNSSTIGVVTSSSSINSSHIHRMPTQQEQQRSQAQDQHSHPHQHIRLPLEVNDGHQTDRYEQQQQMHNHHQHHAQLNDGSQMQVLIAPYNDHSHSQHHHASNGNNPHHGQMIHGLMNGIEPGGVIIQDINLASASWSSPEDLYSI